jgi:hypothetical protein
MNGIAAGGWHRISWVWALHNEHRLVIPDLFLAADWFWFRATQIFLLVSIFIVQLATLALLAWVLRRSAQLESSAWRTGVGLMAFCLFCPLQYENFARGFQIGFVLPPLFVTIAVAALLLYESQGRKRRYLILAIFAGLLATYSIASGMLVWPLLIFAGILCGIRRRTLIIIGSIAALAIAAYLFHYVSPRRHAAPTDSLRHLSSVLSYVAAYFGRTWVASRVSRAIAVGVPALLAAFAIMIAALRWSRHRLFAIFAVSTMLFCLGTAFLTALGRLNLGIDQAGSSRYQTIALLFWGCAGLLLLAAAARSPSRIVLPALQSLFVAVMAYASRFARQELDVAYQETLNVRVASSALLAGVYDPGALQELFPDPNLVITASGILRQRRWSIFADPRYLQLGLPMTNFYSIAPANQCLGYVDSIFAAGSAGHEGYQLTGWAWDRSQQQPPANVMFVQKGIISGFAEVGIPRADARERIRVGDVQLGWAGYARLIDAASPVQVYSLRSGAHSACYIGERKLVR